MHGKKQLHHSVYLWDHWLVNQKFWYLTFKDELTKSSKQAGPPFTNYHRSLWYYLELILQFVVHCIVNTLNSRVTSVFESILSHCDSKKVNREIQLGTSQISLCASTTLCPLKILLPDLNHWHLNQKNKFIRHKIKSWMFLLSLF